jgi:two-component system nitrate/nitrite response regulator NarL
MRIVVCDDHALLLEAMEIALTNLGHDVVAVAMHPDDAARLVAEHRPDVCLLDVNFPTGSSLPVVAQLRASSPDTKVVMVSADSVPALVIQAIEAGAAGFVRKDQPIQHVIESLELAIEGHLAVDPDLLQTALRTKASGDDPLWALSFLTDREWQVLRCIVEGSTTAEIARALGVRGSTARTHVQNVLTKLGVHSRLQAAALIAAHGSQDIWPAHVRQQA